MQGDKLALTNKKLILNNIFQRVQKPIIFNNDH